MDSETEQFYARCERIVKRTAAKVCRRCPAGIGREDLEQIGRMALCRRRAHLMRKPDAFIATVVHGAMVDAVRGREWREAARSRDAERIHVIEPAPMSSRVSDPLVGRALRRLPERDRLILELRMRCFTQVEIARELRVSRHVIRRAEERALKAIRRILRLAA